MEPKNRGHPSSIQASHSSVVSHHKTEGWADKRTSVRTSILYKPLIPTWRFTFTPYRSLFYDDAAIVWRTRCGHAPPPWGLPSPSRAPPSPRLGTRRPPRAWLVWSASSSHAPPGAATRPRPFRAWCRVQFNGNSFVPLPSAAPPGLRRVSATNRSRRRLTTTTTTTTTTIRGTLCARVGARYQQDASLAPKSPFDAPVVNTQASPPPPHHRHRSMMHRSMIHRTTCSG